MNINKKWLKDENDNFIAPRTLTSAIQDEYGNSFQEYADNMIIMDSDGIINVPTDLTSNITNADIHNIVSDVYDSNKTYAIGNYCIYNNKLYKCNTAITTAEEFNTNHWSVTSIDNEISKLNNNYNNLFKMAFFGGVTTDNSGLFDTGISSSKMPCGIAVSGLIGRLYNANSRWYVQVIDVTTNNILPNYTVSIWFYYLDTNITIN